MLVATQAPRIFDFASKGKSIPLADPNPNMSPEAVLNFYANTYPELTTAKISGPEFKNDVLEYKFESVLGTKG